MKPETKKLLKDFAVYGAVLVGCVAVCSAIDATILHTLAANAKKTPEAVMKITQLGAGIGVGNGFMCFALQLAYREKWGCWMWQKSVSGPKPKL